MKRGRPRAAGSDAGSGAAEPLGALLVDSLGAPVGKHRVPRDRRPTKPQKDLVPPFWSERKYGVARGQWEPRRARNQRTKVRNGVVQLTCATRAVTQPSTAGPGHSWNSATSHRAR